MSVIHVGHIRNNVLSRFGDLVDIADVTTAGEDHRLMVRLTRSLAAFAIAEMGQVDELTAAQCVTDGTGDNGIDAVYFDAVERNCFLVQSKWVSSGNGSVEVGEIHKFVQGIRDILEGRFDRFNEKMHRHREKIFAALSDANARFTIALAYTGEQTLSKEAHAPLDDLLSEMNSPSEVVALRILNQGELHGTVASGAAGESIYLEVMLQQWGMLQAPYLAYYGQASVGDIASWASFGNRLTAKNLRQFKGLTEVNESITRTLTSSPDRFWYFNNGITVLCESLRKKPLGGASNETGMFECHGASVVNGAQTVGAIVEASTKAGNGSLTGGRVLVRLVSLEDCPPGFGDEMTRATNTQNRIEKRDFAALDPNQRRLRTELYLEHQKEYAYQTGEQAPSESAGCTLDEAAVALACRMPEVSLAVQAKREVGMLYEDITKPPYTALFNPGTTAAALWDAVCILRLVEAQLKEEQQERSGKEQLIAIHGNRFVLHMVFQALAKPAVAESDDAKKAQVVASLTSSLLAGTIDKVLQHFQAGYPANLFKNASKCRDLKNFITGAA